MIQTRDGSPFQACRHSLGFGVTIHDCHLHHLNVWTCSVIDCLHDSLTRQKYEARQTEPEDLNDGFLLFFFYPVMACNELWLALGGGEGRGWCGTAWLSMGSKVVSVRFLPPFSASTRPAVLASPPAAAAVCASAVKEVVLDVCVLPKGMYNVSSLSTREGSDGSSNAPRWWLSDKSEKRASLLQEDYLNWPNN